MSRSRCATRNSFRRARLPKACVSMLVDICGLGSFLSACEPALFLFAGSGPGLVINPERVQGHSSRTGARGLPASLFFQVAGPVAAPVAEDEEEGVQDIFLRVIHKRLSVELRDFAAGAFDHRLGGGRIPFRG